MAWPHNYRARHEALQRATRTLRSVLTRDTIEAWMRELESDPEAITEVFDAFGATEELLAAYSDPGGRDG